MTRARSDEGPFQRLIEAAPDGIVISRQGSILYANAAAARLLGYGSEADLVGVSMASFLDADGVATMRARIVETQRTGVPLPPLEYPARRLDGGHAVAEITSLPIEYEGAPAVLAFARDVTERASLRGRLERADRLAAVGRLAAGVAHEVNNPLTYVSLGLESLRRKLTAALPEGAQLEDALTVIGQLRHGTDRVARIVRDLRAFARTEEESCGPVDLGQVFESALRMVAHEIRPRATLIRDVPELPAVLGDAGRLEQVFVNLVLNAAQALEEGREGSTVTVRARVEGDRVIVEVADNGPGIPPDVLERIFDPFFTTKPVGVGTGLGLSICETILKRLGGEISVVSALGEGTTFRVELAVAEGAAVAARRKMSSAPESREVRRARIAVIDDEAPVASTLRELLGDHHEVVIEVDPVEGAARVLRDTFDVVLCDVMMPGLSGMDLYERVRAARPAAAERFVFITGGAFTPRAHEFLARVPNARLDKPFTLSTLESAIRDVLKRLGPA